MATLNRVDPDSTVYLLREILAELRSMNPYRLSRPQPEGDEPVEVQDPNQTQLPLGSGTDLGQARQTSLKVVNAAQTSAALGEENSARPDGASSEPGADGASAEAPQKPGPETAPGRGDEQGPAA